MGHAGAVDTTHVGIVGVGHVGMAAASALFHASLVSRLTLVDLDERRAEGEAMDLMHGQSLVGPCTVRSGSAKELVGAGVVVVAAGVSQRPGETRLDLLTRNVDVFRTVVADLDRYAGEAVVVVATNPVDVMARVVHALSDRPIERVIGTGTMLDSARLRALLGRHYEVDPQSVHAYVLGEHGDTEFVPWSIASIGGTVLRDRTVLGRAWDPVLAESIETQVRTAAYEIIARKGWTNWAIGSVIRELVAAILRDERTIAPVSVPLTGEYGITGPWLSLPARIGAGGVDAIVAPPLEPGEQAALEASATTLARVGDALDL
ncbi:MAG: L-lactate dehydrogenase [Acidimicrobiales bacterium]